MLSSFDIMASEARSWYFIKNFVQTEDNHEQFEQTKRFPSGEDYERVHGGLVDRFDALLRRQVLGTTIGIPKSRQMMVSWVVDAYLLKHAMFYASQLIDIQSKVEEDSIFQLNRCKFIYKNLIYAEEWHNFSPVKKPIDSQSTKVLEFANGSIIRAFPEGGKKVRSFSPTIHFMDEAAFQDEGEDAYNAAIACSQLIISVSTPEPSHFQKLVEDTF